MSPGGDTNGASRKKLLLYLFFIIEFEQHILNLISILILFLLLLTLLENRIVLSGYLNVPGYLIAY